MQGVTKLSPGRYRIRVTVVTEGGRKDVERTVRGSPSFAATQREKLRAELVAAASEDPRRRWTLGEYAEWWMRQRAPRLKPSTRAKYAADLDLHLLPRLGDCRLGAIRAAAVAGAIHSARGWAGTNRLRLLRAMSADAMAEGLIDRDFCARIKVPAPTGYTDERPNILTSEEARKLLAEVKVRHSTWYPLVLTLLLTGMRWGEASALTWGDIDLEAGTIKVRRNNWKGVVGETKTGRHRTIEIPADPPELMEVLRGAWRAVQRGLPPSVLEMRRVGAEREGLRLVFPSRDGGLHRGSPLRRVLDEACAGAGVTRVTPHGLRRTANNLHRQMAGAFVAKALLGHSTEAMHEHYSRADRDEKRRAVGAVLRAVV